ncbi:hypothetical protein [Nesterenkonia natronophila]|uniref:Glycosyltransferase family 29 protein n=1 Tax=Nesterenkonia natronophila TaxID=2174932 RepID=A0A3A4F3R1_9MICC|nr:hypothetical protein [Nesterenkonia natronophila]RJN32992.1 hypothetical protein D3250_04070 [Nesterenkonia natronophila]
MAVSLHGLRWKIAAAALFTRTARRLGRIPASAWLIRNTAARLQPRDQEATGTYRGIAADLLTRTLPADEQADGITYDPVAGLVPGTPVERPRPIDLAARAINSPSAGNHLAAAAAHRKPYVSDLSAAVNHYEQAFAVNPKDLRAVEGALTIGARTHYDWPRIWNVVQVLTPRRGPLRAGTGFWDELSRIFAQAPGPHAVQCAKTMLEDHRGELPSLHQLLLEAIAARMQFLGEFAVGFQVREAAARNRVKELAGIPLESGIWLKHLLGAYAYLEDHQWLRATAKTPPVDRSDPRTRLHAQKLHADAALIMGDAAPLQGHTLDRRHTMRLPGEEGMSELVEGKRIAVVGPSSGDGLGELIESFDVVVRTRHAPAGTYEHAGGRTDIAYYAGRDLLRDFAEISAAAESGTFQRAVTRPFFVEAPSLQKWPQWLRPARFEQGLYFRGAPMGLQRIVYDLLQFQPAELAVFNADLYAGETFAASGYRASYSAFGPHNQTNDVVIMHDLAYEFRWTARLHQAGLITAHGTTAEVLSLSENDYLSRLESGPLGVGSKAREGGVS